MLPGILPLTPAFISRPWGGNLLKALKGLESSQGEKIGESWEVSCHSDGPSTFNGKALPLSIKFDYLVKFIEAKENLSVQAHPDDHFASLHENSWGKSECWLILQAAAGAGIYLGFVEGVSKEIFESSVREGKDLRPLLRFHPVAAGDFFYVPAGSVHAIGEGVTLVEVQQSSGITYRVWDWNRVDHLGKGRELHIDKAMQVLNFSTACQSDIFFMVKRGVYQKDGETLLIEHPQFSVLLYSSYSQSKWNPPHNLANRPAAAICLGGSFTISNEQEQVELGPFHSALCTSGEIQIAGGAGAKLLWIF